MNKSYKSVWNEITGTYVAASELAKGRGKSSRKTALVTALLAIGVSMDAIAGGLDGGSATGAAAEAIGTGAKASATNAVAVGQGANATAANSIYIGGNTDGSGKAAAIDSVAIGTNTVVDDNSTAGIALGRLASVTNAQNGIAIGNASSVTAANAVALGANSTADRANTVSVGSTTATRQIVNVAAGTQNTDAVNYAQLKAAGLKTDTSGNATNSFVAYDDTTKGRATLGGTSGTKLSNVAAGVAATDAVNMSQLQSEDKKIDTAGRNAASALGGGATYSAISGAISAPTYNVAGGTQHDVGTALSSLNSATVQFNGAGGAADVKGNKIVNVAAGTVSESSTDAVNGAQLYTTNDNVTKNTDAILTLNTAITNINSGSTGLVQQDATSHAITVASATAGTTVDFTGTAGARQLKGVAAGAANTDAVNIGQLKTAGLTTDASGNVTNAFVAYNDATKGKVTLGGGNAGTTLTNVAAGALSDSSSDAVNGSQLYKTNQDVAANSDAIKKNNDAITQNTDAITKNADAIDNVASSVSDITKQLDSGEVGLVQQDQTTRNLTVGATTDGLQISMAGTAGNRVVTGVAAGALSDSSSDAVNGSQLYKTNQDVAANSDAITKNADAIALNTDAITKNADAIDNVASSVSDITKQLDSGEVGLVQQDQTTRNLTVGAATDGLQISMAGTAGNRVVTGVAAGALSDSSSDAVNGSQLYKTNQDVAANSDAIKKNSDAITQNTDAITKNGDAIALNTDAITKNGDAIALNTDAITKNADAITNVDSRVTKVEDSVSNITNQINNGELGLVQQDQTSRDLMVASDKDGAHVNFAGTAGARELIGVAAGTTSNSAVNVGQLSPVVASLGGGAQVNADGSVTGPTYHVQGATQTTVGGALDSLDNGLSTLQTQINNGSIGMVTQNQTSRDILVGAATDGLRVNMAGTAGNRVVTGVAAGAIGAQSSDAVNGSQLYATAASTASALGGGSTVNANGTVSAPTYNVGGTTVNNVGAAITNIDDRVTQNTSDIDSLQKSVGTMTGSVANAVSYDSAAHNQVTLGGSASAPKVKLTNLQDGELSATSSDAVTGAQLWNTNQQVANLNQAVQNQQSTGSSALAIDTSGAPAATATGSGAIAMGGGAQASGDNSVALGAGSVADQANTVSVGSPGNERRITNVADGQGPTDAVNMRQFQQGLGSVARNAYSGVAAATALTMIPEVDPGKTLAVGIAGGNYKGYQAVALGASARITANLKVKIGAGISAADTTYGAGASYQW